MMPSVQEILANSKRLILDFKKGSGQDRVDELYVENPIEKFIHKKYLQVLAPESFEWSDIIASYYIDEGWESRHRPYVDNPTIIIHGHKRGEGCSLPAQCHVLGYKPTGEEPRPFLENWERFGYD